MSADNGICLLRTSDKFKKIDENSFENLFDERILAYRVAHAQAIDNFDWYIENELHNLGTWMKDIFGKSPVFYDYGEALAHAEKISESIGYTEYGISTMNAEDYNFPGF